MAASLKMRQLKSKISELQKHYQLLLKERQTDIAALIPMADLAHLDDKTLMGGFLFLKEKISTEDPIMEAWHVAGEKFLRQHKPKPQHDGRQCKAGKQENYGHQSSKQAEARSRVSSQKSDTPHPNDPHQTTDQPAQEYPQPGEA